MAGHKGGRERELEHREIVQSLLSKGADQVQHELLDQCLWVLPLPVGNAMSSRRAKHQSDLGLQTQSVHEAVWATDQPLQGYALSQIHGNTKLE